MRGVEESEPGNDAHSRDCGHCREIAETGDGETEEKQRSGGRAATYLPPSVYVLYLNLFRIYGTYSCVYTVSVDIVYTVPFTIHPLGNGACLLIFLGRV